MVAWKVLSADTRGHLPGRTLGRRRDVGAESRLGALETNPVLVREAQRWMDEVLADLDSTSERAVRD